MEIWNYDTPGPDCDGCFLASLRITCAVADLGSLDHSYPGYRREKRGGGGFKVHISVKHFFSRIPMVYRGYRYLSIDTVHQSLALSLWG